MVLLLLKHLVLLQFLLIPEIYLHINEEVFGYAICDNNTHLLLKILNVSLTDRTFK